MKQSRIKSESAPRRRLRVLVADDDTPFARRLGDYLWDHGFEARVTSRISEAKEIVEFWKPDTVFIDLFLPETNALSLFKFLNMRSLKKRPRVIVMSRQKHAKGIEEMRRAGADEYLIKPFSLEDAFQMALPVEKDKPEPREAIPLGTGPATIKELHLVGLFMKQAMSDRGRGSLYNLMRMMNLKTQAIRTSLIRCLNDGTGLVLASNDDENIQDLPISLEHYPEVREARASGRPVIIPNVRTSDLMAPVQPQLKGKPYETMVLFPIHRHGKFFGVMSVRMDRKDPLEIFYVEKFGQVCAQIISMAIGTPGQSLVNL